MNLQSERMGKAARISLDGELTIYSVAEIKAGLAEAMNSADQIEIDLSGITEIDTAGLQLLILLKKEAQRAGKTVSIVAHSQSVRAVIDFCNLAAELGDPLVIPAAEAS